MFEQVIQILLPMKFDEQKDTNNGPTQVSQTTVPYLFFI